MTHLKLTFSILLACLLSTFTDINGQIPFDENLSTLKVEKTDDDKIKLTWDSDDINNEPFLIERSVEGARNFTTIADNVIGSDYIDQNTEIGKIYMYKLTNSQKEWEIKVGFEISRVDYRGRLLLIVEQSLTATLQEKIDQWISNVEGDGWEVIQKNITKSATDVEVKATIKQEYTSQEGLQSLFIFGDIAVPYSGSQAYDGHSNHVGAWPTDTYYADMDERWTDTLLNYPSTNLRIQNIPGDGKYDKNYLNDAELQMGRVDLANMTLFPESEEELLELYLDKNNDFKMRKIIPKLQAFGRDNFGGDSGGAASKYFPNLVGVENFKTGTYRTDLTTDSYLIAYGGGGGTYTSASGISNSQNMVTDSLQVIFTSSWGSYFGDWDNSNNYLRAHLCSGTVLTSIWSVNNYNNMALGNTIGADVKTYQSPLTAGYRNRVASLMGDPTLRMEMGNPVDQFSLEMEDASVKIDWQYDYNNLDQITHFNIYRKSNAETKYELIAHLISDINTYIDTDLTKSGTTQYMIRAEYLVTTPSGSYYNQGIGIPKTIDVPLIDMDNDGYDNYEDCNDQVATINPGIEEVPNNFIDDNCNGIVDEQDVDQDGYYDDIDCDDLNTEINPAAEEIINNGIDENCDGLDDLASECYAYNGTPQRTFLNNHGYSSGPEPCDELDGLPIDHEVIPNDAFVFYGEDRRSYTFSFCEGYNENVWKAIILVFPYNRITGEIGPLQEYVEGCEFTFTIDSTLLATPDIVLVVKDKNKCHLDLNDCTPNGFMRLTCAYNDFDQDGYFDYQECDDFNADVNPDQVEIPFNGLDDDCNESTLDDDGDQDGYSVTDDCDDEDPNINPGALEIFDNMIDDNCNGVIDENDADGDGFPPETDCDDTNADIYPGAYDYPNNGLDEDCDGNEFEVDSCLYYNWGPCDDFGDVDEFCGDEPLVSEYQASAATSYLIKNLTPNTSYVFSFCEDFDFTVWSPLITIVQYNNVNEEIGLIINGIADCEIDFTFPYDSEFPDILAIVNRADDCMPTSAPQSVTNYIFYCIIDGDNDGYFPHEDCDDNDPLVNPAMAEIPFNMIDDDCDPTTLDNDGDMDGYPIDDDCDDTNPLVYPGALEIPNNGIDEDCDGIVDELDGDGDGYDFDNDCDDADPAINPNAQEILNNGVDDNCDGIIEEVEACTTNSSGPYSTLNDAGPCENIASATWEVWSNESYTINNLISNKIYFFDFCDGYDPIVWEGLLTVVESNNEDNTTGNIIAAMPGCRIEFYHEFTAEYPDIIVYVNDRNNCTGPTQNTNNGIPTFGCLETSDADQDGYSIFDDCNDNNPNINPGATEIPYNGLDDDCNPITLDDDLDQDGFALADDCDDTNTDINPDKSEIPYNGIDDDCNPMTLDDDIDQDGYLLADDCDDNNSNINPDQTEEPYNGTDDDCNPITLDDDLDQDGFLFVDDCDDNNYDINPDQIEEAYNGIDDDCDPATLDDDLDQDGFLLADDCDDNNPAVNPDAEEIPNNDIDEDCDGVDLLSSVHEINNIKIQVYPNPVSDKFFLTINGSLDYDVKLYNLNGQLVLSARNPKSISTESLENGTYLLKFQDLQSANHFVEKIVVFK